MPSLATWFTPSLQTFARSAGRTSVLAAAYRACLKLTDERLGKTKDYTPKGKHGLVGNICIGIPNDDIGKLWNDAEKAETRANSTVARELMVPLPSDWSDVQRGKCARGLGEMLRARYGVAVLVSIHRPSPDNNNEHAHIMFTTRTVDADGIFGKKTRILDEAKTGEVKKLREAVCELVNVQAKEQGDDWYVYAGKFSDIIVDHIPTTHISIAHGKKQKQYIDANRKEVKAAREFLATAPEEMAKIGADIADLQAQLELEESSQNASPVPDKSDNGAIVVQTAKIDLKRIAMPAAAIEAKKQIEIALFSRKTLYQGFDAWKEMRDQLLANPPTPKYGFFGRPTSSYKKAWAKHIEDVQGAKDSMAECKDKATALVAYIKAPERQRLHDVYKETIAHNGKVEVHEKHMAQQRELEWERMAQAQREREREQESQIDWSARLHESTREMEAKREQASATEYSSGGMGM